MRGYDVKKPPSQRRKTSSGGFTGPRSGRGSVEGRNDQVNRWYSAKAERGTIFDVRRFSTHDGSGIRTTVFFKGCSLNCRWCHNPEGIPTTRQPLFFEKRCIGCRLCEKAARAAGEQIGVERTMPAGNDEPASVLVRGIPYRAHDTENVALWERMIESCPSGALAWDSRTVTSAALASELLRDLPFFRHGGGVTLSGGEPLLQPEFAADVLRRCQTAGVHTAIETALAVPEANLRTVLPHLDHVFADCKMPAIPPARRTSSGDTLFPDRHDPHAADSAVYGDGRKHPRCRSVPREREPRHPLRTSQLQSPCRREIPSRRACVLL